MHRLFFIITLITASFTTLAHCNSDYESIWKKYQEGNYSKFLEQTQILFEKSKKEGVFDGVIAEIGKETTHLASLEEKTGDSSSTIAEEMQNKLSTLKQERNTQLRALCQQFEEAPLAQKILNILNTKELKEEEKHALSSVYQMRWHPVTATDSTLSQELHNIAMTTYLKTLLVSMQYRQSQTSQTEKNEQILALRIQQYQEMNQAVQALNANSPLKQSIELAAKSFPIAETRKINEVYLKLLMKGKLEGQTQLIQPLKGILSDYQKKKNQLIHYSSKALAALEHNTVQMD